MRKVGQSFKLLRSEDLTTPDGYTDEPRFNVLMSDICHGKLQSALTTNHNWGGYWEEEFNNPRFRMGVRFSKHNTTGYANYAFDDGSVRTASNIKYVDISWNNERTFVSGGRWGAGQDVFSIPVDWAVEWE